MTNNNKKIAYRAMFLLIALTLFLPLISHAGTTGAEFQEVYDTLRGWTAGYLGRAIAMGAFVVGLGWGIAKSSPATALAGVAMAFFIMVGPNVLDAIASATI